MSADNAVKGEEDIRKLIEEAFISINAKNKEGDKDINTNISGYKTMYKFEDLPKDFQKYYGQENKGNDIDIGNGCHFRLIPKK